MPPTPKPPADPFAEVRARFAELTDAVEKLPFTGLDQRVRAEDVLTRCRHSLLTCQVVRS